MPSALSEAKAAPTDGHLAADSLGTLAERPLGIYVHVPFCSSRCGYCDFNTYTAAELGAEEGASRSGYLRAVHGELGLARHVLGDHAAPVSTLFVGGGTPTLLPAADLVRLVADVREQFDLTPDVEITTESNPESIDADGLHRLVDGGFNRISFGMQSASPHVLATLDRVHSPGRPQQAVAEAKDAGFQRTSLDLIFGTPGESMADWARSLDTALAAEPDHISAYALIVESGTRLAAQVKRGVVPMTDDDDLADKYLMAEEVLVSAGFDAYEVSNWSRSPESRCRHNLGYWRSDNWWGIGPGAHSHIGGTRWWNVKHPTAYAGRLEQHLSPVYARETLSDEGRRIERVMLELRLATGLDLDVLTESERPRVTDFERRDLARVTDGRMVLTLHGRLMADGVIRDLLD